MKKRPNRIRLAAVLTTGLLLSGCEELALHEHIREAIQLEPVQIVHTANPDGTADVDISVDLFNSKSDAEIRYTLDSEEPTEDSPRYDGTLLLSGHDKHFTLKARAFHSNHYPSEIVSQKFYIAYSAVAEPVLTPAEGTFSADTTVVLSSPTGSATIYYTIDGTAPTESSPVYQGPITINGQNSPVYIKAFAAVPKMPSSGIVEGQYIIDYPRTAKPVLSPLPGSYTDSQDITILAGEAGSSVFYTTDGSDPREAANPARKQYSTPIPVHGLGTTITLQVYAEKPQRKESLLVIGAYSIQADKTPAPGFSIPPGPYNTDIDVELNADANTTVYYTYTEDGSQPPMPLINDDGTPHRGDVYTPGSPIHRSADGTTLRITAIARHSDLSQSDPVSGTWVIDKTPPAAPSFASIGINGGFTNDPTPNFSWSATGDSYQISLDLGTWIDVAGTSYTPASAFNDGSHTAAVRAVDLAGNVSTSAAANIVVDTVPPTVVSVSPGEKLLGVPTDSSGVTYSVTVSDANFSATGFSAWIIDSGGSVSSGSTISGSTATITGVSPLNLDEEHFIKVTATDLAGNTLNNHTAGRFVTGAIFWSDENRIMKGRISNLDDPDYPATTWYTAPVQYDIPDIEYGAGLIWWIETDGTASGLARSTHPEFSSNTGAGFQGSPSLVYRDLEYDAVNDKVYYTIPAGWSGSTIRELVYNPGSNVSVETTATAPNPDGLDYAGGYYYWGGGQMLTSRSDGKSIGPGGVISPADFSGLAYYNNRIYIVATRPPSPPPPVDGPEYYTSFIAVWTTNAAFDSYASNWYTFDTGFNSATLADYDGDIEILPAGSAYSGIYALIPESNGTNEGMSLVRFSSFTTPDMASANRLRSINVTGQHASSGKVGGLAIVD